MSDPSKSYHLEIVFQRREDAGMIVTLMESLGFGAKISMRKGRFVVYLKEGEQISDLLGAMGATGSLMKLENERILKDIAGNINRQVNFDAANLKKTGLTSKRQSEDIEYIDSKTVVKQAGSAAVGNAKLSVPLAGLIDIDMEIARQNKKLEKLSKEKAGLEGRMNNKNFVEHAPQEVLEQTKARIDELTVEENTVKELINSLKA